MDCIFCGNSKFFGNQVCHTDVLVDGDGHFVEDAGVYHADRPFGPFQCACCGATYEDLEKGTLIDAPEPDWRNQKGPFKKVLDMVDGAARIQRWDGPTYQVRITFKHDSDSTPSTLILRQNGYEDLPRLNVRQDDDGMPICVRVDARAQEDCSLSDYADLLKKAELAKQVGEAIEEWFLDPIREGTFDKGDPIPEAEEV